MFHKHQGEYESVLKLWAKYQNGFGFLDQNRFLLFFRTPSSEKANMPKYFLGHSNKFCQDNSRPFVVFRIFNQILEFKWVRVRIEFPIYLRNTRRERMSPEKYHDESALTIYILKALAIIVMVFDGIEWFTWTGQARVSSEIPNEQMSLIKYCILTFGRDYSSTKSAQRWTGLCWFNPCRLCQLKYYRNITHGNPVYEFPAIYSRSHPTEMPLLPHHPVIIVGRVLPFKYQDILIFYSGSSDNERPNKSP